MSIEILETCKIEVGRRITAHLAKKLNRIIDLED